MDYDDRQRLIYHSVGNRITRYTYDLNGRLVGVNYPDGQSETRVYDGAGRLVAVSDEQQNRRELSYDLEGNLLSDTLIDSVGATAYTKRHHYNSHYQRDVTTDANNYDEVFAYDPNGNLTHTRDANQHPTTQVYDPLDRLTESSDALQGVTDYEYDAQGNLVQVTDPTGLTTTYDYDGLGNLLSQSSPDTGTTRYTYDEAGNRLSQTDARGVTVHYTYDALNRLTAIAYPDSSRNISYTYDQGAHGIGRLTRMQDAEGATDYAYNAYGDLLTHTCTSLDGVITQYSYSYDPQGHLASLRYPSGHRVHYSYTQGQLTGLSLETPEGATQPLVSQIQRLPFGPIRALDFGNGLSLSRTYDQDYRLIAQSLPGVLEDSYGHDPVGNIIDWQDLLQTARDQQFGYDALDRLISASGAYGDLGYAYDPVGNRLSFSEGTDTETYDYVPDTHRLHEILGATTDTRQYDANGNTLESAQGSYTYDDTNRLVSFTQGSTTATYAYNGKGERIRKEVNGSITRFRYAPSGELLGEYDATGQAIREYVYLEGQPIAQIQQDNQPYGIDFTQNPILSYGGGTSQDISGSVETSSDGVIMVGNTWKKIAFPYTVTPNTILAFDFESTQQGELHGIGFDTDDAISPDRSFIVYGTQSWGIRSEGRYSGSGQQHFEIPVGNYFTGSMQWLTLTNDHDVAEPTGESRFRNVRVYEAGAETGDEGSALVYLHTDHLGTVVKATDPAQNVVWDAVRRPFGERAVEVAQVEVLLGFAGQYFDQESGNFQNYFRDYDPTTGRYLQSDPIGQAGGLNTYSYVSNRPLSFVDPMGLAEVCWSWGGNWPHQFICVGDECAGRWPWDGMYPNCPSKGRILDEEKNDALFCTDDDDGDSECEKTAYDQCVLEYIHKIDQCTIYDYMNYNCIQWVTHVREMCRSIAKEKCPLK